MQALLDEAGLASCKAVFPVTLETGMLPRVANSCPLPGSRTHWKALLFQAANFLKMHPKSAIAICLCACRRAALVLVLGAAHLPEHSSFRLRSRGALGALSLSLSLSLSVLLTSGILASCLASLALTLLIRPILGALSS